MKKLLCYFILCSISSNLFSQEIVFKGKIENEEYNIYILMDLIDKSVIIPQQELFGTLLGYIGQKDDPRKWIIIDAKVSGKTALLSIINDYGSEDLTASLTPYNDGFLLKQEQGSKIKIVKSGKYLKLPKCIYFRRVE